MDIVHRPLIGGSREQTTEKRYVPPKKQPIFLIIEVFFYLIFAISNTLLPHLCIQGARHFGEILPYAG